MKSSRYCPFLLTLSLFLPTPSLAQQPFHPNSQQESEKTSNHTQADSDSLLVEDELDNLQWDDFLPSAQDSQPLVLESPKSTTSKQQSITGYAHCSSKLTNQVIGSII